MCRMYIRIYIDMNRPLIYYTSCVLFIVSVLATAKTYTRHLQQHHAAKKPCRYSGLPSRLAYAQGGLLNIRHHTHTHCAYKRYFYYVRKSFESRRYHVKLSFHVRIRYTRLPLPTVASETSPRSCRTHTRQRDGKQNIMY